MSDYYTTKNEATEERGINLQRRKSSHIQTRRGADEEKETMTMTRKEATTHPLHSI